MRKKKSVLEGGESPYRPGGQAVHDLAASPSDVSVSDGAECLRNVVSQEWADLRADPTSVEREGRANVELTADCRVTAPPDPDSVDGDGCANQELNAKGGVTVHPDLIDAIRLNYRLAKSAEQSRIGIDQRLVSFVRVYLTAWTPEGEEVDREKSNAQARRVIEAVRDAGATKKRKSKKAKESEDAELCELVASMVMAAEPARQHFDATRALHRKEVEKIVRDLPAWERIGHARGFSEWGLGVLIGEAGDIGTYSGCRTLYKRLGLAPNECYPKGEGKNTGRMIPRNSRGRVMGIIADALFKAQWAAERGPNGEKLKANEKGGEGNIAGHAKGPYGQVYGDNKARQLANGKTKMHAEKLARRALVKALIHDVHRAWHGMPLTYGGHA